MYCPQCLKEYREEIILCAACEVPLVAGHPAKRHERDGLDLVTVLEAQDSIALSLAKAALDDAGIAYLAADEDPLDLPGFHGASGIGATPIWKCCVPIRVPREFESAARSLLESLQSESEGELNESEPGEHSE